MIALPGGFRPRRRLDQYFLIDEEVLQAEVHLANITRSDVVLEIGAGNGGLTQFIARKAGHVLAIEKDPRLVDHLKKVCPDNVEVIEGDALELEFPSFNKAMGNLPYSISSPLIFKLLDHEFELGVVCLQYEFARRMIAEPGTKDYSRLSVIISLKTNMTCLSMKVPKTAFWPEPEVDSAIVKFAPGDPGHPDQVSAEIIRMIFCHKRKTLANAIRDSDGELIRVFGVSSKEVLCGFDANWESRVFRMTPDEIIDFAQSLKKLISNK